MFGFTHKETAEEALQRIREEIKRENTKRLSDPKLYLNCKPRLNGALHEVERVQVEIEAKDGES
jgi:hypothetical protein